MESEKFLDQIIGWNTAGYRHVQQVLLRRDHCYFGQPGMGGQEGGGRLPILVHQTRHGLSQSVVNQIRRGQLQSREQLGMELGRQVGTGRVDRHVVHRCRRRRVLLFLFLTVRQGRFRRCHCQFIIG
jgi:hypothetical protein